MSSAPESSSQSQQNEVVDLGDTFFFGPPLSKSQLAEAQSRKGLVQRPPDKKGVDKLIPPMPFEDRADPTIHEDHLSFKRIFKYFSTLLNDTMLTIQEILERTFEPHEIRLLEAAAAPSPLASLQRDNIIRYQRILETRFKGQKQSLELKFTLLFFGLPVAPINPGLPQLDVPKDLDFGMDDLVKKSDPLEFLDSFSERTYGDPSKRVTDPYFPRLCQTQEFPSMSLRGGALPTKMEWETDDAPQPKRHRPMRVYGYQGSVLSDANKLLYPRFVEAVDQILGLASPINYTICLEVWNLSDVERAEIVGKATGMVRHTGANPPPTDELYALLLRWFIHNTSDGEYGCFVYFDKEESPKSCQPFYELERYLVRVWDAGNQRMAYMRVPENLSSSHNPNQLQAEYLRTMRSLFPQVPHGYLQFTQAGPITYGLFDPPTEIWTQIIKDQASNGELPLLSFNVFPIPDDHVAVWVPGRYAYRNEFSPQQQKSATRKAGTLHKDNLKLTGTSDDRAGLAAILNEVEGSNPRATKAADFVGIDLWFPGDDYLDTEVEPRQVLLSNKGITGQALVDWRDVLSGFHTSRIHSTPTKLNIVARPVFRSYRFHAKLSDDRTFVMPKLDGQGSFAKFKAAVESSLFPEYSDNQEGLVLHLTQTTWRRNRMDFVIGSDTDEDGWNWIIRRITEPDITVSVKNWSSGWSMEDKTKWGLRYGAGVPSDQISSRTEVPWLKKPFDESMDKIFKDSINNQKSAARARELRAKLYWDTPSIFTNPVKPAIPIHTAPIESIVRTGPYVPGYTTAMRTPGEMARLERETHTLRGNLLDRIRECPYNDCQRYFPFRDREGLARHLTEDHQTLRCFLCDKESTLLPYYDQNSIRRHFIDVHQRDIADAMGRTIVSNVPVPGPSQPTQSAQPSRPTQPTSAGPKPTVFKPKTPKPTDLEPNKPSRIDAIRNSGRGRGGRRVNTRPDTQETPVINTDFRVHNQSPYWREATELDPIPPRRAPSPVWDLLLEKQATEPLSFQPDPEWRCSRCFRAAGDNIHQAEMHMSKDGSCKIRRGLGSEDISKLPNRSGWIIPSGRIDFSKAFFDFIAKYPAYRGTMFPVREHSVKKTYILPYDPATAVGSARDDPNFPANIEQNRSLELPWPPYKEGTAIPLNEPPIDYSDDLYDEPPEVPREETSRPTPPTFNLGEKPGRIDYDDLFGSGSENTPIDTSHTAINPPQVSSGGRDVHINIPDPFYAPPKGKEPGKSDNPLPPLNPQESDSGSLGSLGAPGDIFDDTGLLPIDNSNPPLNPFKDRTPIGLKPLDRDTSSFIPVRTEELSGTSEDRPLNIEISELVRRNNSLFPPTEDLTTELTTADESGTGTEYVPTGTEDEPEKPETSKSRQKRKRENDPTFNLNLQTAGDDEIISEEFSEVSAVPDPIQNLEPDAPRTPKKPKNRQSRPNSNKRQPKPQSGSGAQGNTSSNRPFVDLPYDENAVTDIVREAGRGTRPPRQWGFRRRSSSTPEGVDSGSRNNWPRTGTEPPP
ncbi:hypothetical protein F4805DRAFT_33171 [Annulohypoxylon moriforme]|nr:hypothetical protein F4805DRAFT_33171 [Annulohypoxylon moriforme]